MRTDLRDARERLYRLAETQAGLFTARQAVSAGISYRLQHYYRARGEWDVVDRGIFRYRLFPLDPHEEYVRWSLWSLSRHGEPQIVLSHETALALHELGDFSPVKIHFIAMRPFKKTPPPLCVVHKDPIEAGEIELRRGFFVTTPLRSLLDGIRTDLEPERMGRAIRVGIARGLVRRADLVSHLTEEQADLYLADVPRDLAGTAEAHP